MNNSIFDDNMDEDEVTPFPTIVIATLDTEWQLLQLQLLIEDNGDTYQKVKVQGQGWHISESESGRTRVAKNVKTNLFIKVIQLPRPSI